VNESAQTPAGERPAPKRIASLIELGVAVAGLGIYLAVLGGLQQWVKLEAAGLPGDLAISGYDSTTLAAGGMRALLVLPLAFCIIVVLIGLLEVPKAERSLVARALARLEDVLIQVLVVLAGVIFGLSAAAGIDTVSPESRPPEFLSLVGLELVLLGCTLSVPLLAIAARAGWRLWRRRRRGGEAGQEGARPDIQAEPDTSGAPRMLLWARRKTAELKRPGSVAAAVALLTANVTIGAILIGLSLRHSEGTAGWVFALGALIVVCIPYVLLALRVAAAIWQTSHQVEKSGAIDEPTAIVLVILCASFFLPLWSGTYLVAISLLVFLAGQAPLAKDFVAEATHWLPRGRAGRTLIVSTLIAACTLVVQTRQPQRFPRATIPVGEGLETEVAVLGRAGKQLLLGLCQRRRDGTSTAVEMIRIPADRVPADRIVDDGYTFYRDHEATLLSGFIDGLGLPAFRPPSIVPPNRPPANVCGRRPHRPSWVFDRLRSFEPPASVK
jgi:arginine exporter protein ArgO